jgi:CRP/FNR family transcriptional regulator, cyclic AMP receptor protein
MTRSLRRHHSPISVEDLLTHSSWFTQISEKAQAQVRADVVERLLASGEMLGHDGEMQHHWFGVAEGLLKWSINSVDGRTVTLGGQSAGSWFGEGTLLRGQPRRSDLVALRPSRIAMLPFETFDWLRRTEPTFDHFLLQQLNERLHWFMGNFAAHRLLDADRLVARALLGLVHPLLNPRGLHHLQISQEEMANLATVSRQRCNETLVALARAGTLELEYGGSGSSTLRLCRRWRGESVAICSKRSYRFRMNKFREALETEFADLAPGVRGGRIPGRNRWRSDKDFQALLVQQAQQLQ